MKYYQMKNYSAKPVTEPPAIEQLINEAIKTANDPTNEWGIGYCTTGDTIAIAHLLKYGEESKFDVKVCKIVSQGEFPRG